MLCLPSAGPLRAGASGRRGRHQGARHLPDECPGDGPGAALSPTHCPHASLPRPARRPVCRRQCRPPGSGMLMTPEGVITDRDTMRRHPPDILLTNYKMLDYLLIRPRDRQLWEHNRPTTLRYVVVDELHTFDGAQGTDLALLLRRLQARLRIPAGHLICVGTSATLGDTLDTAPLREYARQVFGVP